MAPSEAAVVTIVGAGPSGLATAAYLHHLSIPYTILEREECYASLWQKHSYDRLHLHLTKNACQLPLMPMPQTYPTYPSRNQFLTYLNDYVLAFGICPKYHRLVVSAEYDEEGKKWRVKARKVASNEDEEYESRFLVVATGETCDPHVPEGLEGFDGEVLHSTEYKNGERFRGKNVLVVGSGNSGMEIALDLANMGAKASIVVRSPMHVLSRGMMSLSMALMKYLSVDWVEWILTMMSILVYGDLTKYGIRRPQEGPFTVKLKYEKYPVIDVGTIAKIKSGEVQVLPAIRSIKGNNVLFENEKQHPFDALVFATGFKSSTQWLKDGYGLFKENGIRDNKRPNPWKGENGLYCAGLGHKGLYGAGVDAQNIAHDIKAQL